MKRICVALVLAALALGGPRYTLAHDRGSAGPGFMGRGPGMMGMGHGMMGFGRGMMGMGPGMMGMGHGMMGFGPGMMGFGLGVTLTEEQQKKLTELRVQFLQDAAQAQVEMIQARAGIQALLLDPSAKDEAIEARVQKAASAHGRLFVLRLRMARRMQELLTKEQREEMMRRYSPGRGPMGPGRGMMGPGGMMPGGQMMPGR